MLWYKAWLETRARFLISLIGITAICAWGVFSGAYGPEPDAAVLFDVHGRLVTMWVGAVTLITSGGLLREKVVGAVSFTLALPFSRTHLTFIRMAVSLVQSMALIVIPWSGIFLMGSTVGMVNSISQARFYVALLTGGGSVFWGIGSLVSSLVEGEYIAPTISFGIFVLMRAHLGSYFQSSWNPLGFVSGMTFHDPLTFLLIGPLPWMEIGMYPLLAALLASASVKAIRLREF